MEVHTHTHTARKKWTHYFWEFLMLFLAVFCGFLAEYQLEHKIEHDRERQYSQSMMQDLAVDTLSIDKVIDQNMSQILGKDSFILLLDKTSWTKDDIRQLYDLHWRYIGYTSVVPFAKRTINQLMNSGGLRIIRNKAVSDSITLYAAECQHIENILQTSIIKFSDDALVASAPIFDNRFIRFKPDHSRERVLLSEEPILLTQDREKIKNFAFMLEQDKDGIIGFTIALKKQRTFAKELIHLLQKKYHLK